MAKIRSFGTTGTIATNAIGSIVDWGEIQVEANIIDVTTHGSANNSKEFIGGLKTGGEVTISGFYDYSDVGQAYLRANIGASAAYVRTYTDGSKASCTVVIKSAGEGAQIDDSVSFSATLQVSGEVTRSAS